MDDQATRLREVVVNKSEYDMKSMKPKSKMEIITVTSGKGGVGKTSFAVNFGIALAARGKRVIIMDADFGLANVDLILGISSKYDITDMLSGEKTLDDILVKGFGGVKFISGGSGLTELLNITDDAFGKIMDGVSQLDKEADILIIDTGAGVNDKILQMINASDETLLILTPEPTSIMDAFAMIKSIIAKDSGHSIRIVVNRADNQEEADTICQNFIDVVEKFLGKRIGELGSVVSDKMVVRAVKDQMPFIIASPFCPAAKQINAIADSYLNIPSESKTEKGGMSEFIKKLLRKK